jgi:hypothetical protein
MTKPPKKVQFIAPDAYPQLMSEQEARQAVRALRAPGTMERANQVIGGFMPPMRRAIREYVDALESADGDMVRIAHVAHEIRGFAETAGLVATGRISEILCRYMDEMERAKRDVEPAIVALHISAICRAARAEDEATRMGETVAAELAALVARKIRELKA